MEPPASQGARVRWNGDDMWRSRCGAEPFHEPGAKGSAQGTKGRQIAAVFDAADRVGHAMRVFKESVSSLKARGPSSASAAFGGR